MAGKKSDVQDSKKHFFLIPITNTDPFVYVIMIHWWKLIDINKRRIGYRSIRQKPNGKKDILMSIYGLLFSIISASINTYHPVKPLSKLWCIQIAILMVKKFNIHVTNDKKIQPMHIMLAKELQWFNEIWLNNNQFCQADK